jgi:tight adherence protein B
MLLVYKIGAMISVCALSIVLWLALIGPFFRRLEKLRLLKQQALEAAGAAAAKTAEKLDFKARARRALGSLEFDPGSKESKKVRLFCGVVVLIISFLIIGRVMFAVICGAVVYSVIGTIFTRKIEKKKKVFDDQLIEALGMITNSVRAGQSLMQAIGNMVKESKPPVAAEFGAAVRQVQLGMSLEEALLDMTRRNPSKDLRIAVTSMNLAKETGGNIGVILTQLTDTMTERRKIQGKIMTLTAQGKASGLVMSVIPFLLLAVLYFMEPKMVGMMFTTMLGNVILSLVVVMIWLASFVIGKIVDIDI